jgi:P27 family predicted phage terminase small subunit
MTSPRKPTILKLLNGSARHDPGRISQREPKPRSGRPVMPADMSDAAKKVWRRVMRNFAASGVITPADEGIFRAYCESIDRLVGATRLIDTSGPLVIDRRHGQMLIKNPLHQIVRDEATLSRLLARELGLTPSSRAGLEVGDDLGADDTARWLLDQPGPLPPLPRPAGKRRKRNRGPITEGEQR